MSVAYIGIGSNLGDREFNCKQAIGLLRQKGIIVSKESSLYETKPWGVRDQPLFLNMAIEIETDLKPSEVLRTIKDIEKETLEKEQFEALFETHEHDGKSNDAPAKNGNWDVRPARA